MKTTGEGYNDCSAKRVEFLHVKVRRGERESNTDGGSEGRMAAARATALAAADAVIEVRFWMLDCANGKRETRRHGPEARARLLGLMELAGYFGWYLTGIRCDTRAVKAATFLWQTDHQCQRWSLPN